MRSSLMGGAALSKIEDSASCLRRHGRVDVKMFIAFGDQLKVEINQFYGT